MGERGALKHGSPEDRGSADRYYGRRYNPHWEWYGETCGGRIEKDQMTAEEIAEYDRGYHGETGEKVWFEPEPREDY